MAALTFPYEFTNGTTADGAQVQEQFDAIKTFLDGLGIDSAGIPSSALIAENAIGSSHLAANSVGTGEIQSDAVTPAKIPRPTISSDNAASTGLIPNTWTDVGCSLSLSAGFYIVMAKMVFSESASLTAAANITHSSRLRAAGVLNDSSRIGGMIDGSTSRETFHVTLVELNDTETVDVQAHTDSLFTTVGTSSYIKAILYAG